MHVQGVLLQRAQARRVARTCGGQVHLRMAHGAYLSHARVARHPAYVAQHGAQQQQQSVHGGRGAVARVT
jgi:hypothetical protein